MNPQLIIHGYRFELTCFACPEQYDVYDQAGTQVAYCRLRHGIFRVHCSDFGGKIVYERMTIGDGTFQTQERMSHLYAAVNKIQEWIVEEKFKPITTDYE